jgi:endonuclease G
MACRLRFIAATFFILFSLAIAPHAEAQNCPPISQSQRAALRRVHLFGGQPSPGPVLVRRGYVTQYDAAHRVPRWSAWRAAPAYLDTPDRDGQWAQFRTDPNVANPVSTNDYSGVGDIDMARGHIVPYFIAGGDRDNDGLKAADEQGELLDLYDACTIFEVNYMSNIAPQFQSAFNGSGGLWFELETRIRQDIVGDAGMTIQIIAGTVFGDAPIETVGAGDIPVPHMFFQILITPVGVVPFLFAHTEQIGSHGCALDELLSACIVAIADIEAVTGLDFFAAFSNAFEALLETPDGAAVWQVLVGD